MCGIAGYLRRGGHALDSGALERMTTCIQHRGPDDHGYFEDADAGVALGHRRLSILDLSPLGHQPMTSAGERFIIVFNGEIYNYRRLAAELEAQGARFRGSSDTEVILAAIEAWGLAAAVRRFVGIFAFALWERDTRTLHLVRDHLGVKPLYYGWHGPSLLFGSELRPLVSVDGFNPRIDRDAIALLLRHNCIPAPHSIYEGVHKLPPGTILTVPPKGAGEPVITPYWSALDAVREARANPLVASDAEATDALEALLRDAIGLQMLADVPLGAFLSGGIDSSTVVALMQAQSDRPVRTFSMGMQDPALDEAAFAREVAAHLGTEHTELYVTPEDALAVVPRLPSLFDEPFADSSQIPTYLVSQLARRHVVVSLSGDGGDELFAGYNRYVFGPRVWRAVRHVPVPLRALGARAIAAVPPDAIAGIARRLGGRRGSNAERMGAYLHKVAGVMAAPSPHALYRGLTSHWADPARVVIGAGDAHGHATEAAALRELGDFVEQMMYLDLVTYLPDDILTKVDRASMAVGLEARVPLLDHRVVEFAWRIPMSQKLRDGTGKWLLREVLARHVPRAMFERPKRGFAVPLHTWLRGPLRDWAESLLAEDRLRREGFFQPAPIRRLWKEHLEGRAEWQYHLWDVLMFQAWHEQQGGR